MRQKQTPKPTLRQKALEYSQTNVRRVTHSTDRVRAEKGFLDGLRAFKQVLDLEAERISAILEKSTLSEFEKGQLDGVLWLRDAAEIVMGFER